MRLRELSVKAFKSKYSMEQFHCLIRLATKKLIFYALIWVRQCQLIKLHTHAVYMRMNFIAIEFNL